MLNCVLLFSKTCLLYVVVWIVTVAWLEIGCIRSHKGATVLNYGLHIYTCFFRSGTDVIWLLMSLLLLFFFLLDDLFKKVQGFVISNQIGVKFGSIVLQLNMHQLTEFDF